MAANPPSQEMNNTMSETIRMINQLARTFAKMKKDPRNNDIEGLKGHPSMWQSWLVEAREQLEAAEVNGTGEQVDLTIAYGNIQNANDEQVPAEVKGLASSIASQISIMNEQYRRNNAPAAPRPKAKDTHTVKPKPKADHQGDGGNNYVPSNIYGRCYAKRTGHGHEGEPCMVRLGKDGVCQYHGGGDAIDISNVA